MDISPSHNLFRHDLENFFTSDPHLKVLSQLRFQHSANWWHSLNFTEPGIFILTGGRQLGKSTSCKLMIKHCLESKIFHPQNIAYLACDEIFDAKSLSQILRTTINAFDEKFYLLIIDEITYVKDWDRVIKAIADEGLISNGICILTGSDTLILKEAAMRFPGRRGAADKVDFHLYPLSFREYVDLVNPNSPPTAEELSLLFSHYLQSGGYLKAINDIAMLGQISQSTYLTYEQWIRGDFLTRNKNEDYLLLVLKALLSTGVSQTSYNTLARNSGLISKETFIDYCRLLERMDILFVLQAYDQNNKRGFPRKDRKFHLSDPFIYHTITRWLEREGYLNEKPRDSTLVEACVASHCHRQAPTYYFKGQGEIDVIWLPQKTPIAIEIKWAEQLRPNDIKTLASFNNRLLLTKQNTRGKIDNTPTLPISEFLQRFPNIDYKLFIA